MTLISHRLHAAATEPERWLSDDAIVLLERFRDVAVCVRLLSFAAVGAGSELRR